jgi:hypothetical protein
MDKPRRAWKHWRRGAFAVRIAMFCRLVPLAALALATQAFLAPAMAEPMPKHVGDCAKTVVRRLETRLLDGDGKPIADSGSAIVFTNGGYQVSYDKAPEIVASRPGDGVRICLVSVPKNCPKGDHRGKVYKTTNLRTHGDWTLPDAEHSCGGA